MGRFYFCFLSPFKTQNNFFVNNDKNPLTIIILFGINLIRIQDLFEKYKNDFMEDLAPRNISQGGCDNFCLIFNAI